MHPQEEKREKARLRSQQYRAANREHCNRVSSEWGAANNERRRLNYAKRRAHYAEMGRLRNVRYRAKCRAEREELAALRAMKPHGMAAAQEN